MEQKDRETAVLQNGQNDEACAYSGDEDSKLVEGDADEMEADAKIQEEEGLDPESLAKAAEENVSRLQYQDKELILIATAHVSKQSVALVKKVIDEEKPDSICVELDEERYKNLKNPKAWESMDIIKVIKSKKVGFLLANLMLGSYQKRIAGKLSTNVGGEMIQGIKSAEETGAELVLADRNIQTTFMRIWRKLSLWEKTKLLYGLVFSFDDEEQELTDESLQELLKEDMLEAAVGELKNEFPTIGKILLSERDQHLAAKIKEAPGPKVVAVLGGAHVPGIKEEVYKEQDLEEITKVPQKGTASKWIGWVIPAAVIALIVYGFFMNRDVGMQQLSAWVLWNGTLAALFTALCFGHPLSILTAFVVAPISSLNPMLACGWFAGLMEAHIRKPRVSDLQNLSEDIFSLKRFFKNRFLRTLLVVVMANIGSSIGTIIGGANIIKVLFG